MAVQPIWSKILTVWVENIILASEKSGGRAYVLSPPAIKGSVINMTNMSDEAIKGDVIAALGIEPQVHEENIRVRVENGFVWLVGVVSTLEEKDIASQVVCGVAGVNGIENGLTVTTEGNISDLELQFSVNDLLTKNGLAGVGAKVEAGNVFLMGVIPDIAVEDRARQIAEEVTGIRSVISDLHIAAGEPVDNIKLSNNVAEALSKNPKIDFRDLHVVSDEGNVTIMGRVPSVGQLGLVTSVAESIPGVKKLNNCMVIEEAQRPAA